MASNRKRSSGGESRSSISYGRQSMSIGTSTSKIPRTTPVMNSSKKRLLSTSKRLMQRSCVSSSDQHFVKDPRPVTDKGHMRQCICRIIKILGDFGYPHTLNSKMMSPPTTKEYFRIVEFVYCLVSPDYKIIGKPEAETAKILSDLGYPISIPKGTLSNIGAMSAWPNALAALDWLLAWVTYYKRLDEMHEEVFFGEDKKSPVLYDYLKATYVAFMHGQDEPYVEINDELDKKLLELGEDDSNDIVKLKACELALDAEIAASEAEKKIVMRLEEEKSRIKNRKSSLDEYFKELEKYVASYKEKREVIQQQITEAREKVSKVKQEQREIKVTVSSQPLNVEDLNNMEIEFGEIETKLRICDDRTSQAQEKFYEKQIQQSKMMDKINKQVAEYVELCQTLEIAPVPDLQDVGDDNFSLTADRKNVEKNVTKLLTFIRPKTMEMKSALLKEYGEAERTKMQKLAVLKQFEEESADGQRDLDNVQKQLDDVQREYEKKQAELKKKTEKEAAELEELYETIKRQQLLNSLSVVDVRKMRDSEKKRMQEGLIRLDREMNESADSFDRLCKNCKERRLKAVELAKRVKERAERAILQFKEKMKAKRLERLDLEKRFLELKENALLFLASSNSGSD